MPFLSLGSRICHKGKDLIYMSQSQRNSVETTGKTYDKSVTKDVQWLLSEVSVHRHFMKKLV